MKEIEIKCSSPYTVDNGINASDKTIAIGELKQWIIKGTIIKHVFRYDIARLSVYRLELIPKPFFTVVLLRLLSRKTAIIVDEIGHIEKVSFPLIIKLFWRWLKDFLSKGKCIKGIQRRAEFLEKQQKIRSNKIKLREDLSPIYLRTDLWFGAKSGGSVGHIAGVVNNLDAYTRKPIFLTSDSIPTVRTDIEDHIIFPSNRYWSFNELPSFHFNIKFYQDCVSLLKEQEISFIYQRYSLNNYSGVEMARHYQVPFVLEYNGSEIWINRNWGNKLKYEELSLKIEMLNLHYADLVVVVSQPMKDELVARGIEPDKILVNPNGVNTEMYNPEVDAACVKTKYGLQDKVVIGFIGTFGKWHGAEILVDAFSKMLKANPTYHERVRLLMIGDGIMMPKVKEIRDKACLQEAIILTGIIPQEEGPNYLAACDILASPHVPNSDGTPFFGSPTKLFEYMAMEKGIVASDLDQIGEILEHKKTAWLVKPGEVDDLINGMVSLIENKELRDELGREARKEVVAHYTWREHTGKIINRLRERCRGILNEETY